MTKPFWVVVLGTLFSATSTMAAQDRAARIRAGDVVRVVARTDSVVWQGRVLVIDPARLVLDFGDMDATLTIPAKSIQHLDRRHRVVDPNRVMLGGIVGTLAGGIVVPLISGAIRPKNREYAAVLALPGAVLGGLVGLIVGMSAGEDRWLPVSP